jgi:signal transduction histidine kinase
MKVHRVLVNLVSNAIKYTKEGEIVVSYKEDNDSVEIRVSDSGIGISKEDQEKLFTKFHRIKSAETEEIQGTGLGLWLTRAIILKLDGEILVESIRGVGTHFIVKLPVVRNGKST